MKEVKRINVIGTSGSGKSTVARRISCRLDIPHIEMDQIFWSKNWTMSSDENFENSLKEKLSKDSWVLDGNYSKTAPTKWKDVQMVIWVDLPFLITLYQAVMRSLRRVVIGQELWEGTECYESFRRSFLSRESVIWWTITTYKKVRSRYEQIMNDNTYSHIKFVRLTSRREIDLFIKGFEK